MSSNEPSRAPGFSVVRGSRRSAVDSSTQSLLRATVDGSGRRRHRPDHDPAGCDRRERGLPSAQADLGFSDANRQWVITAYVLAFGSLLPLGGRLADTFGRKTMFLVGLLGFAVASAVGGAAPNIGTLITARAVQGGFAAVLAPAALSLIAVIFTDLKELNKAFGIFGAVSGSAGAIGLLLGGLLTDYVNWRWCMYVNIAFAVVGIIGGLTLLHNSTDARQAQAFRAEHDHRLGGDLRRGLRLGQGPDRRLGLGRSP